MEKMICREKGCLYLWHKDNSASINAEDVEIGDMMYISICDGLGCDGYDAAIGKPEDFREKLYVEYEYIIPTTPSELVEFKDENGEWDSCECIWVKITDILGDSNE